MKRFLLLSVALICCLIAQHLFAYSFTGPDSGIKEITIEEGCYGSMGMMDVTRIYNPDTEQYRTHIRVSDMGGGFPWSELVYPDAGEADDVPVYIKWTGSINGYFIYPSINGGEIGSAYASIYGATGMLATYNWAIYTPEDTYKVGSAIVPITYDMNSGFYRLDFFMGGNLYSNSPWPDPVSYGNVFGPWDLQGNEQIVEQLYSFMSSGKQTFEILGTTAPVPEPTTILLLGLGLMGLAGVRRKFKK